MSRFNKSEDGTPIQQSMTVDKSDYRSLNVNRLMRGVILAIRYSDDITNASSYHREDGRGHYHLADVMIIDDGSGSTLFLKNVVITPDTNSGIDNYSECLPRPSSQTAFAEDINAALQQVDLNSLDGDQCIVGFLGGKLDRPFILKYWPHPQNVYDPATSGQAVPDEDNNTTTLVQQGRYFRRINGVECTITESGDTLLSTSLAGSGIAPGEPAYRGRFPRRNLDAFGGSVRINIKPSQTLKLDWNPQEDGIGVGDLAVDDIPQTNPPTTPPSAEVGDEFTVIDADQEEFSLFSPVSISLITTGVLSFQSAGDTEITTAENLEMQTGGDSSHLVTGTHTITADANATINSGTVVELEAPQVKLGADASEAFLGGNSFLDAATAYVTAVDLFATGIGPITTSPAIATTLATALKTAGEVFLSQISSALSTKVVGE